LRSCSYTKLRCSLSRLLQSISRVRGCPKGRLHPPHFDYYYYYYYYYILAQGLARASLRLGWEGALPPWARSRGRHPLTARPWGPGVSAGQCAGAAPPTSCPTVPSTRASSSWRCTRGAASWVRPPLRPGLSASLCLGAARSRDRVWRGLRGGLPPRGGGRVLHLGGGGWPFLPTCASSRLVVGFRALPVLTHASSLRCSSSSSWSWLGAWRVCAPPRRVGHRLCLGGVLSLWLRGYVGGGVARVCVKALRTSSSERFVVGVCRCCVVVSSSSYHGASAPAVALSIRAHYYYYY
jgi:hypothetical protein